MFRGVFGFRVFGFRFVRCFAASLVFVFWHFAMFRRRAAGSRTAATGSDSAPTAAAAVDRIGAVFLQEKLRCLELITKHLIAKFDRHILWWLGSDGSALPMQFGRQRW